MNIFDLYTDYLQTTPDLATATGLSGMLHKGSIPRLGKFVC